MAFKDGDFLEVEYTMWDAATKDMMATTEEKRAREAGRYDEKARYGPVLLVLGSRGIIKGLDREVRGMAEGETRKFTFEPADAFGERMDGLVRVMPLSSFRQRNIEPYPGLKVDLDNVTATVKSVTSGRVTVDANHPFAGKQVLYEVRVVKYLGADKDRFEALAKSYAVKPTHMNAYADTLELFFDNGVAKNADYFVGKTSFIASAFSYFKNLKKVDVKEEYLRGAEEKAGRA